MKKTIASLLLVGLPLLLSGCTLSTTSSPQFKRITEEQLANGSTTKVGYIEPDASWNCKEIARTANTWGTDQFKGMVKFGGGYQVLQEKAIDYANQNNLQPNYIYLFVPSQTAINGFNLHPFAQARAVYYQCQNPPAVYNKLF